MSFIKDNGGLLAVGAVALVVLFQIIKWQVATEVTEQLESAGVVKTATITVMKDDIEDNEEDIGDLTTRWNSLVDSIAQLGRTEGE